MPPEQLQGMLPAFYKLGTLADMSLMARKLALARKAIREIRDMENYLEVHKDDVPEEVFQKGMKQTKDYALIVAGAMKEAIEILLGVKSKIVRYRERVHDAVD